MKEIDPNIENFPTTNRKIGLSGDFSSTNFNVDYIFIHKYASLEPLVNVPPPHPTVDAGPDQTVDEGDTVSFSGSFTDPTPSDSYTISWDFGDGSTALVLTPMHVYADNGAYTGTLTITDNNCGVGTDTLTVTVNNIAPTITSLTGPIDPVEVNTAVSMTGAFTDQGVLDTHTATFDWGDGATQKAVR